MVQMVSTFKICQGWICGPGYNLSWRMFCVHLRKRWNALFLGKMPCRYKLGLTGPLYLLTCVSLLIFYLVHLPIGVSGVIKFPTIVLLQLISPFILVSICHMYWGTPTLVAFIIVISSSWIDPLIIMCPSLSLIIVFILKSILSQYCYSRFPFVSICKKYLSSPSLSVCICP